MPRGGWRTRLPRPRVSRLTLLVLVSLAVATGFVVVLIGLEKAESERQNRFADQSSGEWNVVQAILQLEKLSVLVERRMRPDGGTSGAQLDEQYEVLWSRLGALLGNPENGAVLAIRAFEPRAVAFDADLAGLAPVVRALGPDDRDGYRRVGLLLARLRQELHVLRGRVHAERVAAHEQLRLVERVYNRPLSVFVLVVLSILVLILELLAVIRRTSSLLQEARLARTEAQTAWQRLHAVISSVPAMIAAWNRDGRCLFANHLYAAFHGLEAERMIGRTIDELRLDAGLGRTVAEVVRTGRPIPFTERVSVPGGGQERTLLGTWVPVHGDAGEVTTVVDVLLDITERKQRERALAEARDRLERQAEEMSGLAAAASRANEAKSKFLAMMSHEIRTPMNALLGFTELLASTPLPAEQRRYVGIIDETGRQLLSVLNDILDFSKLEARKVEVERIPFDLAALLGSTRLLAEMLLAEKAVAFELVVEPDVPACIRGDPIRGKQILANLLTNAAKFTAEGLIRLEAGRRPLGTGAPGLRLAVTDTGIGVAAEQVPRLFRVFSQADGSTSRRFGGTGLGLAICRELVELMGGRIGVETREGRGSTFWLELPLAAGGVAAGPGDLRRRRRGGDPAGRAGSARPRAHGHQHARDERPRGHPPDPAAGRGRGPGADRGAHRQRRRRRRRGLPCRRHGRLPPQAGRPRGPGRADRSPRRGTCRGVTRARPQTAGLPSNASSSRRVEGSVRKVPVSRLVIIEAPCLRTPRVVMQWWVASTMTATPCGSSTSWMTLAICAVIRSWICRRPAKASTRRASLLIPTTRRVGR